MQLDIRTGHAQTVDKVINWLSSDGELGNTTVCDVRSTPISPSAALAQPHSTPHAARCTHLHSPAALISSCVWLQCGSSLRVPVTGWLRYWEPQHPAGSERRSCVRERHLLLHGG